MTTTLGTNGKTEPPFLKVPALKVPLAHGARVDPQEKSGRACWIDSRERIVDSWSC